MSLRGVLLSGIATAAVVLAGDQGIRPRPAPEDYPGRQVTDGFTVAAAVLTPDQVKKRFATNLNHGYIVVEVAVFPPKDKDVTVAAKDFMARFGTSPEIGRPVSPQAIAARLGKKDAPPPGDPGKVHVYTEETIGYEHGPSGPNGRSTSGVYTGTTTGVGVGDPPYPPPSQPSSSGMDRASIQAELEALALPEQTLTEDTAGYLYFDKPSKGKPSPLRLTYYGRQGKIELRLPLK